MELRLEHANICVRDVERMIRFLQTAFPKFRVRGEGVKEDGTRWMHIGNDDTYIALNQASVEPAEEWVPYRGLPGINHLAFEVDDVKSLSDRMTRAGYRDSTVPNAHPYRRRVYFYDPEGNDWEFIQYLSTDPTKRSDYELSD